MQENDLNFCYSLKLIDLVQSFAYLTSWLGRLSEDFSLKILNKCLAPVQRESFYNFCTRITVGISY